MNSEMNPIRVAFLGCGFATKLHSKTISKINQNVSCYYASRAAEKAQSYNQRFDGVGIFSSYEAAIQSDEVDVIFVATPPASHMELTLSALKAGKHVMVEKPPFLKSKDFDTIEKESNKSGKQVFIAENYFYKPLLSHLQSLIKSKIIGEVLFVHINALKQQKIKGWRGDTNLSGGGALFEGGIHWINFVSNLGLNLKTVKGWRPGSLEGMDKSILISLEYEEKAVGSLYHSWETPSLFKGLRISKIYGTEGSITFESNGIFIIVRGREKKFIFPGLKDIAGYKGMFEDFFQSIREEKEPDFTFSLAKKDIVTIEKIYASIKS